MDADDSLRRGDSTFKLIFEKVTEADKESIRYTRLELSMITLKDYQYNSSKLVQMFDTLKANAAFKSDYSNGSIRAFMGNERAE